MAKVTNEDVVQGGCAFTVVTLAILFACAVIYLIYAAAQWLLGHV